MRDRRFSGAAEVLLVSLVVAAAVVLPRSHAAADSTPMDAIALGDRHSCTLLEGGVVCWGNNVSGQLGDGTTTNSSTPVDVQGLSSGVIAIDAGGGHTCALTLAGGVKCWGNNDKGELGNGTTTDSSTPVEVQGLTSGVRAISTGYHHTCALTEAGGVKCWGLNNYGQLGNYTTTDSTTPVEVMNLSSGVRAVTAGGWHTCALTDGGGMKCWGEGRDGQLGIGSQIYRTFPVDVSGLSSGVEAITAGYKHTCALLPTGGMMCWGDNWAGEVGDGTTHDRRNPVPVAGLSSGVEAITTGRFHTCALMDTGALKCWGYNAYGQLGDGTTITKLTPVGVSGLSSGVVGMGGGYFHTCAVMQTGGAKCWGGNGDGQLGNGTTAQSLVPVDVLFPGPDALIKRSTSSSYRGDDVFNITGTSQTVRAKVSPGASASFDVQIQNQQSDSDGFLASGCGSSAGFTVRYRAGSTNVTADVVAGTYSTGSLAPGAQTSLTAKVTARSTATVGAVKSCLLTVTSEASPTRKDAVGFKVTVM